MRKIILVTSLMLFVVSGQLLGQCNPYYILSEGSTWEYTSYNAKDKLDGRQINEVKSFDETADGWEANLRFVIYDKKDAVVMEKEEVELACENGIIHMDMERFLPAEMMQAFEDSDMQIDIDNMELPADLEVGQTLDEGSVKVSGGMPFAIEITITNRKVVGKESVTTPAGTFDCYKITYDMKTKSMVSMETSGVEWIAKEVGMVKSENYKKNGKLMSYSLLTKVDR